MADKKRTDMPEVGLDVTLSQDFECFPTGIWAAGETGTVEISEDDQIGVKLDKHYPELDEWDNCLMFYSNGQGLTHDEMIADFWSKVEERAPAPGPA